MMLPQLFITWIRDWCSACSAILHRFQASKSIWARIARSTRSRRTLGSSASKLEASRPVFGGRNNLAVPSITALVRDIKMRQARICYINLVEREADEIHRSPVLGDAPRQIDFRHMQTQTGPSRRHRAREAIEAGWRAVSSAICRIAVALLYPCITRNVTPYASSTGASVPRRCPFPTKPRL